MEEIFVNDIEAAKILSVSPQTLRNYRHLGRPPVYYKRGRMVRYKLADLLEFMEGGRIDPEARREGL
jgi:predicted site-specific integrase-resolvase